MNKKILLAGTSYSAAPIFFCLKESGYPVAVCGAIKEDPCHSYADESYYIDYSQHALLLEVVQQEKISHLCPSCNDYAYMACTRVAETLGLPGYDPYETSLILHSKHAFRQFMTKHGLPSPAMILAHQAQAESTIPLKFPVLVKPVDSFSGRGVTKIEDASEVHTAIQTAQDSSRSKKAIVEEYVDGNLYSHSAFIKKGNVVFDTFVDEYCSIYPYQVDCSNSPTSLPTSLQNEVRECMVAVVKLLNLNDGLLHTQFIAQENQFWIIECMRRCPGDLYYRLIELATGVNGHALYVKPFLGEALPDKIRPKQQRYYARHTISVESETIASSFTHRIPSKHVQIVPLKQSGHVLEAAPYDKLAILYAEFESRQELFLYTPRFAEFINIHHPRDLYHER